MCAHRVLYVLTHSFLPRPLSDLVLPESPNIQPRAGNAVPGKRRVDQLVTRQLLAILAAEIVREEEIAVEHQIAIRRMERQRPANRGRTREAWRILVDVGSIKHHTSGQGRRQRNAVDLNLRVRRSEEHTSELQSLMRISYAVFCLKKKTRRPTRRSNNQ